MVSDVQFVNQTNCQSDLEQLIIINTSIGTSHIYNLNKYRNQNESPVIKSPDYECGGLNNTKLNFFQQQLQQMKVKNVQPEIRFRYHEAAEVSQQAAQKYEGTGEEKDNSAYYTDTADSAGGLGTLINKAATGAGILSQAPELDFLVSSLRQEWDAEMECF